MVLKLDTFHLEHFTNNRKFILELIFIFMNINLSCRNKKIFLLFNRN